MDRVTKIVGEFSKVKSIKEDDLLKEDLGLDSIDLIELAMAVEDEFDISIKDEELYKFKTVQDIIDFVN